MQYTVKSGDTLSMIAKRVLGDPMRYKSIVFANNLEPPFTLEIGDVLDIPVDVDLKFTAEQLRPISVYLPDEVREEITQLINLNLARWGIDEPLEIAHFLAQVSHESAGFKCRVENLNYSAKALRGVFGKYFPTDELAEEYARQPERIANRVYANRMGNGPEESGDGWKRRGQGYIQLTGTNNQLACGRDLELPFDSNPDMIGSNACVALLTAAWFWNENDLGKYARADDLVTLTKRINGGTHGLESRRKRLVAIKETLGIL